MAELWLEPGVFPSFCGYQNLVQGMEYTLLIRPSHLALQADMASADATALG